MVASWWSRAGLGILVHWTPASVPGWAPPHVPADELPLAGRRAPLGWSSRAEWYENALRFPGSPVSAHHRATYGTRPYAAFGGDFNDALHAWDPTGWARAFRAAGARYAVLVVKHHDGFCLWPSAIRNPHRAGWHTRRDVAGEFAEAVRAEGMRFGVHYSGGLDRTFDGRPVAGPADLVRAVPRGGYPDYASAQLRELTRRYRPDVLRTDLFWPGTRIDARRLVDYHRFTVPHGVVGHPVPAPPIRHALRLPGAGTLYERWARRAGTGDGGHPAPGPGDRGLRTGTGPYEVTRDIGPGAGHNRAAPPGSFLRREELEALVRDTAADGNLLLTVGPRGEDATIPAEQRLRLDWLAECSGRFRTAAATGE
ncbi:alpha-L-fucosidase [Streptomyces sp. NPDC015184]|uniref:alpha-L-fucosidase n=1 Tax=Streptomyces sp. NPDC015184 TaxID=3364946 RepID=UPI0036F8DD1D